MQKKLGLQPVSEVLQLAACEPFLQGAQRLVTQHKPVLSAPLRFCQTVTPSGRGPLGPVGVCDPAGHRCHCVDPSCWSGCYCRSAASVCPSVPGCPCALPIKPRSALGARDRRCSPFDHRVGNWVVIWGPRAVSSNLRNQQDERKERGKREERENT